MTRPHVLIIVQNLPVPLDRRVWLECRALVNFCGNAVATLFIGRWTKTLDLDQARAVLNKEAVPELGDTPIRQLDIEPPEPVITDDEYDRHRFQNDAEHDDHGQPIGQKSSAGTTTVKD